MMVAIVVEQIRNDGNGCTVLEHRPDQIEVVGTGRADRLVDSADRYQRVAAKQEEVLEVSRLPLDRRQRLVNRLRGAALQ